MKLNGSRSVTLAAVALAIALLAPAAHGQTRPGTRPEPEALRVEAVWVAVWDPETKAELAALVPGERLELEEGEAVILRIFSPADKNPTGERLYLSARFEVESGHHHLELHDVDVDKGSCRVRAVPSPRRGAGPRHALLRYELVGEVTAARAYQERGAVEFEIAEPDYPISKGEEMVRILYRAILLRELDPERARERIEMVERQGYRGLLEAAYEIAESRESRITIYERGVSNQERLLGLYEHLLGREAGQVDLREWQDNLDRLAAGEITAVVLEIVRSYEFRRYHGIRRPPRPYRR